VEYGRLINTGSTALVMRMVTDTVVLRLGLPLSMALIVNYTNTKTHDDIIETSIV
jgi:hypothetical protein